MPVGAAFTLLLQFFTREARCGWDNAGLMSTKWCKMQIPSQLEGFDIDDAIARMLGRPQLWWQTLGYFVHAFADWPQHWQASQADAGSERRVVHALRSAAANVGAQQLADAARQLEQVLLAGTVGMPGTVTELRIHLLAAFSLCWESAAEAWTRSGATLPEE